MSSSNKSEIIREAVGVFSSARTLQAAIDELLSSGFDRAELSLLAGADTVDAKLGHQFEKVAVLEDDAHTPRTCYVSPESLGDAEGALVGGLIYVGAVAATGAVVASGGSLALAIFAAAGLAGAGGVIGACLAKILGDFQAAQIQEHLDRGGLLLWVRTWTPEDEKRAVEILSKHSTADVHVHDISV